MPRGSDKQPGEQSIPINRRHLLAMGAAGLSGIAGCSSQNESDVTPVDDMENSDGSSDGTSTTTSDDNSGHSAQQGDKAYTAASEGPPPENLQFNLFNPISTPADRTGFAFDRLAIRHTGRQEWIGSIATNWEISNGAAIVQLYENHKWQSGDPLTATDLVTQLKIESHTGAPVFNLIENIQADGEHTVRLALSNPDINKQIFWNRLFTDRFLFAPDSVFGEDLQKIEEAGSEEERSAIVSEITQRTFTTPEDAHKVCSGLWMFDGVDNQYSYYTKYQDYENQYISGSDLQDFTVECKYYESRQRNLTEWQQDLYDGGAADGQESFWNPLFEKDWIHTKETPLNIGLGLNYNFSDPVYSNRKVRQAFTYVLDLEAIAQNAPYLPRSTKIPDPYNTGVISPVAKEFMNTSGFLGYERNLEKAEQLMREAGFERNNNDQWAGTIDGKGLQATVKIPPWWKRQGTTATNQLREFGVPLDSLVQEGTQHDSDMRSGNWRLSSYAYGGGYHPWTAYTNGDYGISDSLINYPADQPQEVPPVGKPNSSNTITITPNEELNKLKTASPEEAKTIATKLGWLYNIDAISSPYFDFVEVTAYTSDDWVMPSVEEEPLMDCYVPFQWAFKRGLADAKTGQ